MCDFIYFPQLLVACAVWLFLHQAMSPILFFLCGAGVGESSWWEDEWRTALVNGGVASEVRVRCAPSAGACGESRPHWWCNYHPKAGERFADARVSDTFSADIAMTAGVVASEVEDAVAAGHRVAFAGSSNGGHVAAEFALRYGAQYLLLASSTPLQHQEDALMHSQIPVVMTIGSSEKYFGGASALSSVARRVGAWRVEFWGCHCREGLAVMEEAADAVRQWLHWVV